jgi:hypothetical protein
VPYGHRHRLTSAYTRQYVTAHPNAGEPPMRHRYRSYDVTVNVPCPRCVFLDKDGEWTYRVTYREGDTPTRDDPGSPAEVEAELLEDCGEDGHYQFVAGGELEAMEQDAIEAAQAMASDGPTAEDAGDVRFHELREEGRI